MSSDDEILKSKQEELSYELHYRRNRRKTPNTKVARLWYNILDFFECCCVTPCPPLPECIIPKFAFEPPNATYTFIVTDKFLNKVPIYKFRYSPEGKILMGRLLNGTIFSDRILDVRCFLIHPSHTKQLACCYMRCPEDMDSTLVVLRCHTNAVDMGIQMQFDSYLSLRLRCDVFELDYCGYGISSGKPSEANIFKDVMAAYYFLTNDLKVDPMRIVVFGQSLGTAAAIHLASSGVPIKGLILEGILMSAFRFLCPGKKRNFFCDQFQSAPKVQNITCPTLVVHGGLDNITYLEHADHFIELCKSLVPPLIIPCGDHNNLQFYRAYWNRLEIFFGQELRSELMPFSIFCGITCSAIHTQETDEDDEGDKDDEDDDDGNHLGNKHLPLDSWPLEYVENK